MARSFDNQGIDYTKLNTTLVNSRVHTENKGLYNVLKALIGGAADFQTGINNSFNKKTDKLDLESQVTGVLPTKNGGIDSGYYFPNVVPFDNVTSVNAFYSHFLVTDRYVQIFGKLNITPTAPNLFSVVEVEVPIPSKFTSSDQLHGLFNGVPLGGGIEGFPGIILGNVGTGYAHLEFYPKTAENYDVRFMISYERVPIS